MANSINPRLITRPRGSKLIAPPRCSPSEDRRVNRLILRSPPIGRRRISPHHRVLSTKLLTPDPYDERLKQTAWAYSSGNSLFFADDSSVSGEGLSFQGIVDRFQINFRVNQRCSISRYPGEGNEIDSINRTGVSKLTHPFPPFRFISTPWNERIDQPPLSRSLSLFLARFAELECRRTRSIRGFSGFQDI